MAEKRTRTPKKRPSPIDAVLRSTAIAEPTRSPFTHKGQDVTPGHILTLWRSNQSAMREDRRRVLAVRAMRRMEESSMIQLPAAWVRANPEAASWVRAVLHERVTLEREQIARVGTVEPEFKVEALGFLERDDTNKERAEAYFREWARSKFGPPVQSMYGKSLEDGSAAYVVLPAADDMDGRPDFYVMLDAAAYAELDDDAKKTYQQDKIDRKGRYVKTDKDGVKVRRAEYAVEPEPDDEKKLDSDERKKRADKRDQASRDRHAEAVQQYLLDKPATHIRLIPALDCAPGFVRSTGSGRWELDHLVTRQLYTVEELISDNMGWSGMGDRKVLPQAYNADGTGMKLAKDELGEHGQFYLYTAYLLVEDEHGCKRPCIFYTVGGASTSTEGVEPDDPNSVGVIDLFDRYKVDGKCPALEGVKLWGYFGGYHTEDDDPAYYWQPYAWPLLPLIRRIEGLLTAISSATSKHSFHGYFSKPDAALAAVEGIAEAFIEDDGQLKPDKIPGPGEIHVTTNEITPVPQQQVGVDAYKMLEHAIGQLQLATSVDEMRGDSGNAMLVGETLAKNAKRHIRDGVLDAFVHMGELHKRILHAIYECHGIRWPLQTVEEKPVGRLGVTQSGREVVEYDPAWIGTRNWAMKAHYPEEQNLSMIDLRRSLYKDGVGTFEDLQQAMGNSDAESEWVKIQLNRLRQSPAYQEAMDLRIAQKRGDKVMTQILKSLQQQQKITQQQVPGAPNGIPTAALNRQATQMATGTPSQGGGGGGAPIASSVRGGIMQGERQAANAQANAQAELNQ